METINTLVVALDTSISSDESSQSEPISRDPTVEEKETPEADPADPSEACPLCLENKAVKQLTDCSHKFCPTCIPAYVDVAIKEGRGWLACPSCQTWISTADLSPDQAKALEANRKGMQEDLQVFDHKFKATARKQHFRKCPSCQVTIQKNGGCNNMSCRCGKSFQWSEAPTVIPCNQIHFANRRKYWCRTCPNCTLLAKLKLTLYRTALVATAIPTAAVAAGAGAVAAVGAGPVIVGAAIKRKYKRRKAAQLRAKQRLRQQQSAIQQVTNCYLFADPSVNLDGLVQTLTDSSSSSAAVVRVSGRYTKINFKPASMDDPPEIGSGVAVFCFDVTNPNSWTRIEEFSSQLTPKLYMALNSNATTDISDVLLLADAHATQTGRRLLQFNEDSAPVMEFLELVTPQGQPYRA